MRPSAAECMGYLNKTCTAGTTSGGSSTYGPTAGPALRAGAGDLPLERWAQWAFTLAGQSRAGYDLATIQTFNPSGRGQPL